ncbi:MAG: PEP-utilizing enzyme, partial [Bryobacteraceae bacterium]
MNLTRRATRIRRRGRGALFLPSPARGANDRIVMGSIGVGGQGSGHLRSLLRIADVRVAAICDVVRHDYRVVASRRAVQRTVGLAGRLHPGGGARQAVIARDPRGLVTDAGGVLPHPAVASREFGIPAVAGTGVATTQIRT